MPVNDSIQALFLGVLQGITEFLPISSSAHLILLPWLVGWEPMGLTFDVMVHGGTLLALVIYFREHWKEIGKQSLRFLMRPSVPPQSGLLGALVVGTLPAILVGGLFQGVIEDHLRTPGVTVLSLPLFGLFLGWADHRGSQSRGLESIRLRDGLIVGLAQALALIPGVSRSGVTITAVLMLGLNRADAARFSFLLGTPVIALATISRLFLLWWSPSYETGSFLTLLVGVIFSFVSSLICIKYLLRFLQIRTYLPFVVYRLLLAVFIFALLVL